MCEKLLCQFCNRVFKRPCALAIHERTCKQNPNRIPLTNHKCNFPHTVKDSGWNCKFCQLNFRTRKELYAHINHFHNGKSVQIHPKKTYKCSFCNKEWETTIEGLHTHERYCIENPNRVMPKSHSVNNELRKRISENQKENYKDKSRFNISRSQEPYSEKYFREWLDKEGIDYRKNYHVDRFFLDFAFPDKKIYFEVNGEQHYRKMYNGRDYQERDKERELILLTHDWKCIASIRWAEFKSLKECDREKYLKDLLLSITS